MNRRNGTTRPTVRCAIYCRVSSDELLSTTITSQVPDTLSLAKLASVCRSSAARLYVGITIENFLAEPLSIFIVRSDLGSLRSRVPPLKCM